MYEGAMNVNVWLLKGLWATHTSCRGRLHSLREQVRGWWNETPTQ